MECFSHNPGSELVTPFWQIVEIQRQSNAISAVSKITLYEGDIVNEIIITTTLNVVIYG